MARLRCKSRRDSRPHLLVVSFVNPQENESMAALATCPQPSLRWYTPGYRVLTLSGRRNKMASTCRPERRHDSFRHILAYLQRLGVRRDVTSFAGFRAGRPCL